MKFPRIGRFLLIVLLGLSFLAWGQGRRRPDRQGHSASRRRFPASRRARSPDRPSRSRRSAGRRHERRSGGLLHLRHDGDGRDPRTRRSPGGDPPENRHQR
jgi:hypothetical protein